MASCKWLKWIPWIYYTFLAIFYGQALVPKRARVILTKKSDGLFDSLWSYLSTETLIHEIQFQMLNNVIKFSAGRLRPHFFKVCKPDIDVSHYYYCKPTPRDTGLGSPALWTFEQPCYPTVKFILLCSADNSAFSSQMKLYVAQLRNQIMWRTFHALGIESCSMIKMRWMPGSGRRNSASSRVTRASPGTGCQ